MRALMITGIGKPLAAVEIATPSLGDGDVLVRVGAAGICRSDLHYRSGTSPVGSLPIVPGHEVAGTIEAAGPAVRIRRPGERVCLHYLVTCGACRYCVSGQEQFCPEGRMIGKNRDGGYAEFIAVPERNAIPLPDAIPLTHGAVLMCSSATSLHAVKKARLSPGETAAVFGLGGLGMSAVQLCFAMGAARVFAVDIDDAKLEIARGYGAEPVDARAGDPVRILTDATAGRGVDVALELVGLPVTMLQALRCLAPLGRAAVAGITDVPITVDTYREIIGREAELIGVSDHHPSELHELIDMVARGRLVLDGIVSATVGLDQVEVNGVLDRMERFGSEVRTVIVP